MPWVCVREILTPCGVVSQGRIVPDGDPMLVGVDMTAFARLDVGDLGQGDAAPVEEATAVPGVKRARARR